MVIYDDRSNIEVTTEKTEPAYKKQNSVPRVSPAGFLKLSRQKGSKVKTQEFDHNPYVSWGGDPACVEINFVKIRGKVCLLTLGQ